MKSAAHSLLDLFRCERYILGLPKEDGESAKSLEPSDDGSVANGPVQATKVPEIPERCTAPIHSDPEVLPGDFVKLLRELEGTLEMPVWLFVQRPLRSKAEEALHTIHPHLLFHWELNIDLLPKSPVALLIHSHGGVGNSAFQMRTFFEIVVVDSWRLCQGLQRVPRPF